jgi:hypothetical protein
MRGRFVVYYVIEASHLFRAGDKFQTQFFVLDVVNFLQHECFAPDTETHVTVLHGSVKDEQAERYAAALERHDIKVIRMKPIDSMVSGKWYFKPTYYIHRMMGTEIPKGSIVVLVGFHNPRYLEFIKKYHDDFEISMAAFGTPSKKMGIMHIPEGFKPFLNHVIDLDKFVTEIKAEFRRKPSIKQ